MAKKEKLIVEEEIPVNTEKTSEIPKEAPVPTEDISEPKTEEETPETTEEKLRKILDLQDGEDIYEKAYTNINALNTYKTENESVNKQLLDVFETQPEIGEFLKDILNGAKVNVAIARNFDLSDLEAQEGDPDYEEWNKALNERKKKLSEKAAYLKEIEDNTELSVKEIHAFAKENDLTDNEAEDFLNKIDELVSEIIKGKVTKDILTAFYKGINYDKDIKDSSEVAEIAGRNAKIDVMKEKANKKKGDGIPKIEKENKVKQKAPITKTDPFSEAINYQLNRRRKRK